VTEVAETRGQHSTYSKNGNKTANINVKKLQ